MQSLHLTSLEMPPRLQRHFMAWAAVVGVSLMSYYVQLLHDSVERGERLRVERCATAALPADCRL